MSNEVNGIDMNKKVIQEMRPKLRFSAFKDSLEWQEKKISEILTETRVLGSKGDAAKKITVKLWGKGVFKKEELNTGSTNTQYYKRKSGQFIYSKLDFLNQAFGIIPHTLDGFESTVDLPCFDWKEGINPIYFLEYVKREGFYRTFGEIADGGRKAKRIQAEMFLSFPILLPRQIAEQQKIADCLTSIDILIDAESSKLDALKKHKKGLMQVLFPQEGETVPRVRFPEFHNTWQKTELNKIAVIITEKVKDQKCILMSVTAGTGLVSQIEKYGREIAGKQYKNYYIIQKNDFAYNKSATKDYPEGFIAMYSGQETAAVPNSVFIGLRVNTDIIFPNYLNYLFLNNIHGKWLKKHITIGARTHGSLSVDNDDLLSLPVPFPQGKLSLQEQQKIADCLSSLDELIATQVQKLVMLKSHKKGLIQGLFPSLEEVG